MNELNVPNITADINGVWMLHPDYQNALAMEGGTIKAAAKTRDGVGYAATQNGIAIIPISGFMMKGSSFWGNSTSTLDTRKAIRHAVNSEAIKGIVLYIDSPGGHVSGTDELAADIRTASDLKPVHAHIDDLGASAAYWVASQASTISANRSANVGSIGAYMVVADMSEMAEKQGIKIHVVKTGEYKAAGAAGTEITEKDLEYFQERIDSATENFYEAVQEGRNMSMENMAAVKSAKVYDSASAQRLGLIDNIRSFDETLQAVSESLVEEKPQGYPLRASAQLKAIMARCDMLKKK